MSIGVDLVGYQPAQLAALAHKAFMFGLLDGSKIATPRDASDLMHHLLPPGTKFRVYHRNKFRQVYRAGFDVARSTLMAQGVEPRPD